MKCILIRHCETDWNVAKRLQGASDTELNENGVLQASLLAEKLVGMGITRIVSSDLKRSSHTADIIFFHVLVPIHLDERLRECHFGTFEGMTWQEVEKVYSIQKQDVYPGAEKEYSFYTFGGESKKEVLKRHMNLLDELKTAYPSETILLIGHGTGLNSLLSSLGYPAGLEREDHRIIEYS